MKLPTPSIEQRNIVKYVNSYNIIVQAYAGTGKSTTIYHIAKRYPSKSILVMTYNARLKMDTREKIRSLKLKNVEAHSYHSFGYKHCGTHCRTDKGLDDVVKQGAPFLKSFKYDLLIVDEAQDMTPLYYKFLCCIIVNNALPLQMCLIGDRHQTIFDYNEADCRFMDEAESLFHECLEKGGNTLSWKLTHLTISYRLTKDMADYVNLNALSPNCIKPDGDNITKFAEGSVQYIKCNIFSSKIRRSKQYKSDVYDIVCDILKKYEPSDIFILSYSLNARGRSPPKQLANHITMNSDIQLYVPRDEEKPDSKVTDGKLVFSTFHQTKGLERKVVIVLGFDSSYFKYYDKSRSDICPNILYVAMTRATEKLILIQHSKHDQLSFLNTAPNVIAQPRTIRRAKRVVMAVTNLVKFIPITLMTNLMQCFSVKPLTVKSYPLDINPLAKQDYLYEAICEINGIAIPAYYEYKKNNSMTILTNLMDNVKWCKTLLEVDIKNPTNITNLLMIATRYSAMRSGYYFKPNQIKYYDWLSEDTVHECHRRLDILLDGPNSSSARMPGTARISDVKPRTSTSDSTFSRIRTRRAKGVKKLQFETKCMYHDDKYDRYIAGMIDIITQNEREGDTIWEIKCVKDVVPEHLLQLALYAYIVEVEWQTDNKCLSNNNYKLFNVQTNMIYQITFEFDRLKDMYNYLINHKLSSFKKDISTPQFIKNMKYTPKTIIHNIHKSITDFDDILDP